MQTEQKKNPYYTQRKYQQQEGTCINYETVQETKLRNERLRKLYTLLQREWKGHPGGVADVGVVEKGNSGTTETTLYQKDFFLCELMGYGCLSHFYWLENSRNI